MAGFCGQGRQQRAGDPLADGAARRATSRAMPGGAAHARHQADGQLHAEHDPGLWNGHGRGVIFRQREVTIRLARADAVRAGEPPRGGRGGRRLPQQTQGMVQPA